MTDKQEATMTDLKRMAEEVLELDKLAYPGPWEEEGERDKSIPGLNEGGYRNSAVFGRAPSWRREKDAARIVGTENGDHIFSEDERRHNGKLISHYRTSAVALARAYLAVVERLEEVGRERDASDAALLECQFDEWWEYLGSEWTYPDEALRKRVTDAIEAARARLARQQGERK